MAHSLACCGPQPVLLRPTACPAAAYSLACCCPQLGLLRSTAWPAVAHRLASCGPGAVKVRFVVDFQVRFAVRIKVRCEVASNFGFGIGCVGVVKFGLKLGLRVDFAFI